MFPDYATKDKKYFSGSLQDLSISLLRSPFAQPNCRKMIHHAREIISHARRRAARGTSAVAAAMLFLGYVITSMGKTIRLKAPVRQVVPAMEDQEWIQAMLASGGEGECHLSSGIYAWRNYGWGTNINCKVPIPVGLRSEKGLCLFMLSCCCMDSKIPTSAHTVERGLLSTSHDINRVPISSLFLEVDVLRASMCDENSHCTSLDGNSTYVLAYNQWGQNLRLD